jgi:hypothetical protein
MNALTRMKMHYYLTSLFQAAADHYSRLTRLDCRFVDFEETEGLVAEFAAELDEMSEDGVDTEEYE